MKCDTWQVIGDRWQVKGNMLRDTGDRLPVTSFMWLVTVYRWYVVGDRWQVTCDRGQEIGDRWQMEKLDNTSCLHTPPSPIFEIRRKQTIPIIFYIFSLNISFLIIPMLEERKFFSFSFTYLENHLCIFLLSYFNILVFDRP